jgi:hypothetical protein
MTLHYLCSLQKLKTGSLNGKPVSTKKIIYRVYGPNTALTIQVEPWKIRSGN